MPARSSRHPTRGSAVPAESGTRTSLGAPGRVPRPPAGDATRKPRCDQRPVFKEPLDAGNIAVRQRIHSARRQRLAAQHRAWRLPRRYTQPQVAFAAAAGHVAREWSASQLLSNSTTAAGNTADALPLAESGVKKHFRIRTSDKAKAKKSEDSFYNKASKSESSSNLGTGSLGRTPEPEEERTPPNTITRRSIISDIFEGIMESRVKCLNCQKVRWHAFYGNLTATRLTLALSNRTTSKKTTFTIYPYK